jgi:hypothetical protein
MTSYVRLAAPVVHRGGFGTCGPGSRSGPAHDSGNLPDGVARRLARRSHHGPQNLRPGTRDRRRDSDPSRPRRAGTGTRNEVLPHFISWPFPARKVTPRRRLTKRDTRVRKTPTPGRPAGPPTRRAREIVCAARADGKTAAHDVWPQSTLWNPVPDSVHCSRASATPGPASARVTAGSESLGPSHGWVTRGLGHPRPGLDPEPGRIVPHGPRAGQ